MLSGVWSKGEHPGPRARAEGEPALALFRVAVLATLMRDVVTEPRLL